MSELPLESPEHDPVGFTRLDSTPELAYRYGFDHHGIGHVSGQGCCEGPAGAFDDNRDYIAEGVKRYHEKLEQEAAADSLKATDTYDWLDPEVNDDPVRSPSHYTDVVPGIECVEVVRHFPYLRGAAIKYLWRAGMKSPDPRQDLEKAIECIHLELDAL